MVDRRLALDIDLFSRGGMRVLDKIAEQHYDVLSRRPAISKVERVWLLLGSLARVAACRGRRDDAGGFLPTAAAWLARARETSTIRLYCSRASNAMPCAPCTRSCAIATI